MTTSNLKFRSPSLHSLRMREQRRLKRIAEGTLYVNIKKSKFGGNKPDTRSAEARNLADAMNRAELSANALAAAVQVTSKSVNRWLYENTRPSDQLVPIINQLLGEVIYEPIVSDVTYHPAAAALVDAMKKSDLSPSQLARLVKVSSNAVYKWLRVGTHPLPETAARLSTLFDKPLYGFVAPPMPAQQEIKSEELYDFDTFSPEDLT